MDSGLNDGVRSRANKRGVVIHAVHGHKRTPEEIDAAKDNL